MKIITSAMLAAVLFFGSSVSALSFDTGVNASGTVNVDSDTGVSVTSETNATATTEVETSGDVSGEALVDAGPVVITASTIEAGADVSTKSSAAVHSKTELNSYARNVVKADADIRDIELSDTEVSVSHRERAKIFGIFAAKVFARASIASDGSVKVTFPWYAFADSKSEIESKVKAAVSASLPISAGANTEGKLSAQAQAQILEKAVAAMQSQFQADTAASAKIQ